MNYCSRETRGSERLEGLEGIKGIEGIEGQRDRGLIAMSYEEFCS